MLDAVRAAHQLSAVDLADETVVWGHSQGGHAALWTGMLAPTYAPELQIDGVAALAPASNLPALVDVVETVTAGALFASYVVEGYTAEYPDVSFDELVRPGARIITREMAQRCLAEPGVLVSALTSVALDKPIWSGDPSSGRVPRPPGRERAVGTDRGAAAGGAGGRRRPGDAGRAAGVRRRPVRGRLRGRLPHLRRPGPRPAGRGRLPAGPRARRVDHDRFAGEPATDTCP